MCRCGCKRVRSSHDSASENRAIRREDLWILQESHDGRIVVRHRHLADLVVNIPRACLEPALRTIAGNHSVDLGTDIDFVVKRDFPESETFFAGDRAPLREILPTWERYVTERMGNLIILRRFPISAPGTVHLCHYSSDLTAGPGTTWVARVDDEEARILSLWFNSSLHLAQIFCERIEDVWLDIHKYILEDMLVLNPHSLSEKKKMKLLDLFNAIRTEHFPSLEEQFRTGFEPRRRMDLEILEAIGFEEPEAVLYSLQKAILLQFDVLRELSSS